MLSLSSLNVHLNSYRIVVDMPNLQNKINEIKINNNNLQLDLRMAKQKTDVANEKFVEIMEPFLEEAQSHYDTIECMQMKMNEAFKELADFYTFEQNKYTMSEFFTDLKTFSQQFQMCHAENVKLKETEEKIRRAEEEKSQREKEKLSRKTQKDKLIQSHSDEMGDTGVMDNLLEALQSGKLFEAGHGSGPTAHGVGGGRGRRPRRDNAMLG